ncbi:MAG TPA: phosphotransferase, partial [Gemmatimonadales bacterium]
PLNTPMHGDFSAAQVLVDPRPGAGPRVAVIDLDGACRGDPVDDLGNLLAQAERQVLDGAHSAGWLEEFAVTLLDGYRRSSGRPLPDRIRLYTAWSLFRKARLPFRTRQPAWQERTEALVERAETVALESGRRHHREPAGLRQ